jgi:hypothetical protein
VLDWRQLCVLFCIYSFHFHLDCNCARQGAAKLVKEGIWKKRKTSGKKKAVVARRSPNSTMGAVHGPVGFINSLNDSLNCFRCVIAFATAFPRSS